MRVIDHCPGQFLPGWKCPNCKRLLDVDEVGFDIGIFSTTLTCPYCNYSQTKYSFFRSFPNFPEWYDEEIDTYYDSDDVEEEEEEDDSSD